MTMKLHSILLTLTATLLCCSALAQTRDVGFQVGVHTALGQRAGVGGDITFGVGYGQFFRSGLGFRTGLQYSASVADINDAFGVPVAFAYRTRSRSAGERLQAGAAGAGSSLSGGGPYRRSGDVARGALGGFLLSLFSDVEFFAGVTPGYVAGASGAPYWSNGGGASYSRDDFWVEKKRAFSLTLDAGTCLNYSIWRFDLKLTPAFHFCPTGNFIYHAGRFTVDGDAVKIQDTSTPIRWFFTFTAGLAYRF